MQVTSCWARIECSKTQILFAAKFRQLISSNKRKIIYIHTNIIFFLALPKAGSNYGGKYVCELKTYAVDNNFSTFSLNALAFSHVKKYEDATFCCGCFHRCHH